LESMLVSTYKNEIMKGHTVSVDQNTYTSLENLPLGFQRLRLGQVDS
jgi:hypothetical protein